jgi:hypothetical protein
MTSINISISHMLRSQLPKVSTPPVLASSDFAALLDQEKSLRAVSSFGELGLFSRPYIPPATSSVSSPTRSNDLGTPTGSRSQAPLHEVSDRPTGHLADGFGVVTTPPGENLTLELTSFMVDSKLPIGFASAPAVEPTQRVATLLARPQSAETGSANQSTAGDSVTEGAFTTPGLPTRVIVEMRDRPAPPQMASRLTVKVEGSNCAIVVGCFDAEHDQNLRLRDTLDDIVTQNGLTLDALTINGTVIPLYSNR